MLAPGGWISVSVRVRIRVSVRVGVRFTVTYPRGNCGASGVRIWVFVRVTCRVSVTVIGYGLD